MTSSPPTHTDIVDIKPVNMEELTEVITAACFHPSECNILVYSSSKGACSVTCDGRTLSGRDRGRWSGWLVVGVVRECLIGGGGGVGSG